MLVKLRLQRFGRKKLPFYRIVVAPISMKRDGRFLEAVGLYHPVVKTDQQYSINNERVHYWLSQGAQPTDTVKDILKKTGLWAEFWAKKPAKKKKRNRYKNVKPKKTQVSEKNKFT